MKYLDKIDESCSLIGAVNTVVNNDGVLKGYNTDMDGFLEPLKKRNIDISNSNVLLLGAGGAARAIVAGFAKEKAKKHHNCKQNNRKSKQPSRICKKDRS